MTDPIIDTARELIALAEKATPGKWKWWTSNSWRRLTAHAIDGTYTREGDVICPTTHQYDRHPDLIVSEENMAHIAAANPEAVAALCHALIERTEALRAARSALAEVERLREALRKVAIARYSGNAIHPLSCQLCRWEAWSDGEPERHAPGCLAALADRKEGA